MSSIGLKNEQCSALEIQLNDFIEHSDLRGLKRTLELGADPNALLPNLNYTPLHSVAGTEDEEFGEAAASLILQHNGNPNVRADEKLTPVHVAASWGHARVLHTLLEGGGCPWLQDELGKTAFDYAQESNDYETIELLFEFTQNSASGAAFKNLFTRTKALRLNKRKRQGKRSLWRCPASLEEAASAAESTASTSGVSSTLPQSSSSESLTGSKRSSLCTSITTDEEASKLSLNILHGLVIPESSTAITNSELRTSNFEEGESQQNSSSPLQVFPLEDSAGCNEFHESSISITNYIKETSSFEDGDTQSGNSCVQRFISHAPRSSVARASIMAPLITITRPSSPFVKLTEERLLEYNSPTSLEPNEFNYTSKRVQQWVKSVSHFSPLATSSNDTYNTCNSHLSIEERLNTAAIGKLNLEVSDSTNSFATVSECFKYTDEKKGVVLLEERWLANPVPLSEVTQTDKSSFSAPVLQTDTETVDTDDLVKELKCHGIFYGPVTASTKRIYKKELHKKRTLHTSFGQQTKYSFELERTLRDSKGMYFISPGAKLEQVVAEQFAKTNTTFNWREGILKTSFTYLLLDPRITKNLPCRAPNLLPKEVWATFLKSIFYIGKGKRSRPYSHLYESVESLRKKFNPRYATKKMNCICEIWQEGLGVVCLHVFQNVIPVEAYTREAAMIDAIGIQNLCNMKRGEYYGKAAHWQNSEKKVFGVYLLYRALQIFLSEGERHLSPFDIKK